MNLVSLVRAAAMIVSLPALVMAQAAQSDAQAAQSDAQAASQPGVGVSLETKIAVIDIDRIAAESKAGQALFNNLKDENDKLAAERAQRQNEIRDMEAKLTSEILSADAKGRLSREIERKRTDAQRWLEDAQREFQEKQQQGEAEFQTRLAPVVEQVAKQHGIGLILRATPGLTFVLDPALDISLAVIEAFNQTETAQPPSGAEAKPPQPQD